MAKASIKNKKIVITGAAGLVGQNLVLLLREQGYQHIVAIDKHTKNIATLVKINPGIEIYSTDLAEPGKWEKEFSDAACVVILQAQITGLHEEDFIRNNITANENILRACHQAKVPYIVQASSTVLHSKADDFYVRTKTAQEKTVVDSGLPYTILRPTLMFGWFDPKHFGWLSRFMAKVPVFPIPGDGKYIRQPLYNRDFCRVIQYCIEHQPVGKSYDIVGAEDITYIDIIRKIKSIKRLKTRIVSIPYKLFDILLKIYALADKHPPFTSSQLHALTIGDYFQGADTQKEFGITLTPLQQAFEETFADPRYSEVVIDR